MNGKTANQKTQDTDFSQYDLDELREWLAQDMAAEDREDATWRVLDEMTDEGYSRLSLEEIFFARSVAYPEVTL